MVDPGTTNTASRPSGEKRRGRDRSRGAVLIEAAMVFPLLILLTFGAIEYGFIYRDELKITTAARSGARIGTADKNPAGTSVNADDDYQILQAVYSALGTYSSHVTYVSIYDAGPSGTGAPAVGCTGAGAASVAGSCDVWSSSDFTSNATTIENSPKYQWTMASRLLNLDTNSNIEPTYLGVEIRATHNYLTGLFGSSRQITERAVFRFEPTGNTSHNNFIPQPTTTTIATTTTVAGQTTTTAPTTTTSSTTSTTHAPTSSTSSTTHAPTSSTTSTTHAPTSSTSSTTSTTHAPTSSTSTSTTVIVIIPT